MRSCGLGWALNPLAGVLIRKGRGHMDKAMWRQRQRLEWDSQGSQGLPEATEAGRGKEGLSDDVWPG